MALGQQFRQAMLKNVSKSFSIRSLSFSAHGNFFEKNASNVHTYMCVLGVKKLVFLKILRT